MGNLAKEVAAYLHPHYVTNVFLAICFYIFKVTPPVCTVLFENCNLEVREMELLTFLGCIVVLKNRKQQSVKVYVGTICTFAKVLCSFLFFMQNPLIGLLYMAVCLLHIAFLPEPVYRGPDYITFFHGDVMEEEIKRDKRVTWLVEFYAAWQPSCVNFSQIYAKLSAEYSLDNLRFAKVDVTRNKALSERFRVDHTSWSRQLPTLAMFQNGKETNRRPMIDSKGRPVGKFVFTKENVVNDFRLNDVYHQCKKNPLKKKKQDLNESEDNKKEN